MNDNKEQWGSRLGFILAAAGSAIGLGNIWRFPYMVYENGGLAFLIPYFIALFSAGIPIMILEFSIGHRFRGGAPLSLGRMNPRWEWLGWLQTIVSAVLAVYYVAIIGWAISYIGFSFTRPWGTDPVGFFVGDFLGLTDGPFNLGGIRLVIAGSVILAWIISYIAQHGGIQKGIERANKIFMPVLIVLLVVIVIRGITLPGAADGLNLMFKADFTKLTSAKVWIAAYSQIFFTLSIAFAVMITYSSYLPKKTDIVNNGFMTALLNCGFSILAGIGVFSIIGFLQYQNGGVLPEKLSGVFLAFATFPSAISQLPALNTLIGVLFFLALTFAGLSSFISINEVVVRSIADKFGFNRRKTTLWYTIIAGLISLIFTTGAGLYILDIVDHYLNNYGIIIAGIAEVVLVGWLFDLKSLRIHANKDSDFTIGPWWDFMLRVVTPLILGVASILNLIEDLTNPYEGYTLSAQLTLGWGVVVAMLVVAIILAQIKWKKQGILTFIPDTE